MQDENHEHESCIIYGNNFIMTIAVLVVVIHMFAADVACRECDC